MVKEGKKRKLVINGAKLEDAGKITAKTNADETSCDLGVAINNGFVKGMREFKQCVEREEIIFNVQVKAKTMLSNRLHTQVLLTQVILMLF